MVHRAFSCKATAERAINITLTQRPQEKRIYQSIILVGAEYEQELNFQRLQNNHVSPCSIQAIEEVGLHPFH